MPHAGFEPAIPASEQPQTHALGRVLNGVGVINFSRQNLFELKLKSVFWKKIFLKTATSFI
jgi:hypothetical protein